MSTIERRNIRRSGSMRGRLLLRRDPGFEIRRLRELDREEFRDEIEQELRKKIEEEMRQKFDIPDNFSRAPSTMKKTTTRVM